MKITKGLITSLIREQMEDVGAPIPPEELHDALSGAIYDLYKYVHGIRPRWIKFDEMSVKELENMHHELTAELEQQAQGEEARSYKPDYDPSEYTRGLEDRYISDHDAYEAEQGRMMTPEDGEELPQRQGMGRRPLVGPARDVRRGRKISEQLKEMIRDEINERCQKGYKTHATRKTKKMFGRTYRNCVKAEGMQSHDDDYSNMPDADLLKAVRAAGMEDHFATGLLDDEDSRREAEELLRMADMEMVNEEEDMFEDVTTKSYLKFAMRNPQERSLLLDLWDDMTSGIPMDKVVADAEERLGYKREKGPFAPMPTVGSEESRLFSLLMGVKFHARKIKDNVRYPTGEQMANEIDKAIERLRAAKKARQAAFAKMPPGEHPIAKYYREKSPGGYTGD